jgi:hypothetical protein
MLSWRVRLTVSPEKFPLTLYARAGFEPAKAACVVPEKLPSGCSVKFSMGTLALARDTTPDSWPPAFVRRTSQLPQRRRPGIARPCTVQIPSAGWVAVAAVICSTARSGETATNGAPNAMNRKGNNLRSIVGRFRSMTLSPYLEAPACFEDLSP